MALHGLGGPESCTEVCKCLSFHDPPLLPRPRTKSPETARCSCPRDGLCWCPCNFRKFFPPSIKINNNDSLGWFDGASGNSTGTHENQSLGNAVNQHNGKPSEFGIASSLGDEPGTKVAMSKVERWSALAKKHAAIASLTSENVNRSGPSTTSESTTTESTPDRSSQGDTTIIKKPALRLFVKPKKVHFATSLSNDEPVTPTRAQPQATARVRKKQRPPHNEITAHLFNNAGLIIPSLPEIDSVTERLFDKGEIMSLRPPRSHDGYYPDGEPIGGSFLMDHSNAKKRKRSDES